MAYISPNTNIKLLHGVPLDNKYDHTILFPTKQQQYSYFNGFAKHNLTNQSYQRVNKGLMRVQVSADDAYDCNYLMFQNTNYGNRWFYAFITEVEYVNNVTCEIKYELDVMQTWHFDYTLEQCFVEREHSTTDAIGGNIVPESFDLGEYVFNDYGMLYNIAQMCVIVAVVDTKQNLTGCVYDGIYGSATLTAYLSDDADGINKLIDDYAQKTDAILSIYMCPKFLLNVKDVPKGGVQLLPAGQSSVSKGVQVQASKLTPSATLDGYKPKNNKLYTYPYNFYHLDNANGNELSLRYEYFKDLTPSFLLMGTFVEPVEVILRPYYYKNVPDDDSVGISTLNTESLTISNYPMCSWATDAYRAWLAQNSIPIAAGVGASVVSGAVGVVTGNPLALASLAGTISSVLSQGYRASIQADISKGTRSSGNANVAHKTQQFFGGRCSIDNHTAKIIDDYFTMYGYATKRLKVPNRNARENWTYTKTIGCEITGSLPADDMNKIKTIYDNGITFWNDGNEIGNYSLSNNMYS